MSGGGASELDKLIKESEDALKRLDSIQHRRHHAPFLRRVGAHLHRNSPYLINVLLMGSVLAVALGRLGQKQEHEAEKREWEEQERRLQADKQAADARSQALLSSTESLVQGLEEALGKGRRDLPQFLRQQLESWRQQQQGQASVPPAAAAAAKPAGGDGDGGSGGGSKIMI